MGSIIEVFPHGSSRERRRRSTDAWRVARVPEGGTPRARPARIADYAAMHALKRLAQPSIPAWTLPQLEAQRHAFPEGQLVAERDGEIVAAASALVIHADDALVEHNRKAITGDGHFATHDKSGDSLYAAEVVTHPGDRGGNATRAITLALRRLARKLNLRRVLVAARLPGYRAAHGALSPEAYVRGVLLGDIDEPFLRLMTLQGFQCCGVLRAYLPEDTESGGHAALLAWLNPSYTPADPPARQQDETPRKCA